MSFSDLSISKIWCTGSNAEILSGELADRLSGRYVEIRVHRLSFTEFLVFHSGGNIEVVEHIHLRDFLSSEF